MREGRKRKRERERVKDGRGGDRQRGREGQAHKREESSFDPSMAFVKGRILYVAKIETLPYH